MDNKKVSDGKLDTVSGGASTGGSKYNACNTLYKKNDSRIRFVINNVIVNSDSGFSYNGMMQIYSLVPPGNGGVLPLPMTPPKYYWFDYANMTIPEQELDAEWDLH